MELGRVKLLRNGVNALHQATHPIHGLAWTDGKQVILTAIHLQNKDAEFGSSTLIGQFDHVHGLFWRPAIDVPALLAVQHKKRITVWQLYYNPLEKNKLVVSQTCEYGDPLPVLPQGCIWHPNKDLLIVLTKRDISILYSVCYNNNNVKADITGSSVIRCACWTKDGSRLVVAMDDSLHSFTWNADQKTLSPSSFCPIFNIDASVVAIQPIMDHQVVVTMETSARNPHTIIKNSEGSSLQSSLMILDEEFSRNSRRLSIDSGKSEPIDMKISSLVPADVSHMLARHRKSDPSPLIHLKQRNLMGVNKPELSNLVIVSFEKNATTTRKVSIPGISSPDILVLDSRAERVAVASNMCNLVLVYPIAPCCMPNIQHIKLEEHERTKGISFVTDNLLLILVGKEKSSDTLFFPTSGSEKYMVQLVTKKILPCEYFPTRLNSSQNLVLDQSSLPTGDCKPMSDSYCTTKEFWMPNNVGSKSPRLRRKFGDIIQSTNLDQSPTSSLDDFDENKLVGGSPLQLEKFKLEPTARRTLKNQPNMSKWSLCGSLSQRSCQNDSVEMQENTVATLNNEGLSTSNLAHYDSHVADSCFCLSEMQEYFKNYPKTYPPSEEPPYISITLQKSSDDGVTETKTVLLCHGKLLLRTVQEIFHVKHVEMNFGTKWVILTEDGEGFIPVTFKANQELFIREVKGHWGSSDSDAGSR